MEIRIKRNHNEIHLTREIQYLVIARTGHPEFTDVLGFRSKLQQVLHRAARQTLIQQQGLHADCSSMIRSSTDAAA